MTCKSNSFGSNANSIEQTYIYVQTYHLFIYLCNEKYLLLILYFIISPSVVKDLLNQNHMQWLLKIRLRDPAQFKKL